MGSGDIPCRRCGKVRSCEWNGGESLSGVHADYKLFYHYISQNVPIGYKKRLSLGASTWHPHEESNRLEVLAGFSIALVSVNECDGVSEERGKKGHLNLPSGWRWAGHPTDGAEAGVICIMSPIRALVK